MNMNEFLDQTSCLYGFHFTQFWKNLVGLQVKIKGYDDETQNDKHLN